MAKKCWAPYIETYDPNNSNNKHICLNCRFEMTGGWPGSCPSCGARTIDHRPLVEFPPFIAAPDPYEALRRLLRFSEQLCADIGVGINSDAQKQARAVLGDGQR